MIWSAPAVCLLPHPDWHEGTDYGAHVELQGVWRYVGPGVHALHVDHATRKVDGSTSIPPGAILRYLGTSYSRNLLDEVGNHIFQILDLGDELGAREAIGTRPPDASPRLGECYEVSEHVDEATPGGWWASTLSPVAEPPAGHA